MNKSLYDRNPNKVIIIPFRFYRGQIEILLKIHAIKIKPFISEISGRITENDPSPVFCAARIFLSEFLNMNHKLDEKVKMSKSFDL